MILTNILSTIISQEDKLASLSTLPYYFNTSLEINQWFLERLNISDRVNCQCVNHTIPELSIFSKKFGSN